jgi:NADPH-dependent 2,4-dienoyl-CoA reductase/sulfur reductase-like enzyme
VLLDQTKVIASPTSGVLLAAHENGPRELRWQRLVLATGARELFLPFPGWTLPGVMGPGGLQALVKNGWPISDQRVVVAGSGPLLLAVADGLRKHGAKVISIAEQAPWSKVLDFALGLWRFPDKMWQGLQLKRRLLGVPYRCGVWPVRAQGDAQLRQVTFTNGDRTWTEECHYLACGFGLVPNLELGLALNCELEQDFVRVDAMQRTSVENVYCAGELTGIGGADCALVEGQIAGHVASGKVARAESLASKKLQWHRFRQGLAAAFALRPELKRMATKQTIVCRCEDVRLERLVRFGGWREAKLQTRCGMGSCQGRVCGAAVKLMLGWEPESVRPPLFPTRIENLISPVAAEQPNKMSAPPFEAQTGKNASAVASPASAGTITEPDAENIKVVTKK